MRLTQHLLRRGITNASSEFQYWKRFVERRQNRYTKQMEWHPLAGWQIEKREKWVYSEQRPWTEPFQRENSSLEEFQVLASHENPSTRVFDRLPDLSVGLELDHELSEFC